MHVKIVYTCISVLITAYTYILICHNTVTIEDQNLHYGIHHYLTKKRGFALILCLRHHFFIFVNPRYKKFDIISYHHDLYHDIIHIHLYCTSLIYNICMTIKCFDYVRR